MMTTILRKSAADRPGVAVKTPAGSDRRGTTEEGGGLMSRGAQNFKQRDVTKACKGAVRAGLEIQRVEIDQATGKIVVFAGKPADPQIAKPANEWDSIK